MVLAISERFLLSSSIPFALQMKSKYNLIQFEKRSPRPCISKLKKGGHLNNIEQLTARKAYKWHFLRVEFAFFNGEFSSSCLKTVQNLHKISQASYFFATESDGGKQG